MGHTGPDDPALRVESGDWGVVCVTRGKLKGQLVFYDDDSDSGAPICYLGYPLMSESKVITRGFLRKATADEERQFREANPVQKAAAAFLKKHPGPG